VLISQLPIKWQEVMQTIAPTGQFREIALDAQKIAKDIAERENLLQQCSARSN